MGGLLFISALLAAAAVWGARVAWRDRRREAAFASAAARAEALLAQAEELRGEPWFEVQEKAVEALHEARLLAPPEARPEIELRLTRERFVWENRFVWGRLERARALLDRAAAEGVETAEREDAAREALEVLQAAQRQNHRPPEIKEMMREAERIVYKPRRESPDASCC